MREIKITARTPVQTIRKILMNCETNNDSSNKLVKSFYRIFAFETNQDTIEMYRKYFVKNVSSKQFLGANNKYMLYFLLDFPEIDEDLENRINEFADSLLEDCKTL